MADEKKKGKYNPIVLDELKKEAQRRKDLISSGDYVKDYNDKWSLKPGVRHKKTKHLKGIDKPGMYKKLDQELSGWVKRGKEREDESRRRRLNKDKKEQE